MKTYLTYGAAMAVANALLTLALYFFGFHSDLAKFQSVQWIGLLAPLTICAVVTVLGTKARREEIPLTQEFGYGSALAAGVMIALFASVFGVVTTYIYTQFINPGFIDLLQQVQTAKMEAKGLSPAQIEQFQKMSAMFMTPIAQAISALIGGMIFGTIVSLVTSAFLKRAPSDTPPALG